MNSSLSQRLLNALRCGLDRLSPIPHDDQRRDNGEREKKGPGREGEVSVERHGEQYTHPYGRDRSFHVFRLHDGSLSTLCNFRCSQMHTRRGAGEDPPDEPPSGRRKNRITSLLRHDSVRFSECPVVQCLHRYTPSISLVFGRRRCRRIKTLCFVVGRRLIR